MSKQIAVGYGTLLQASLDYNAARRLDSIRGFEVDHQGIARWSIPLFATAAIAPADVGSSQGDRVAADIGFVRGDPSVNEILSRIPVYYGPSDSGKLPFGSALPEVDVRVEGTARTAAESSAAIGGTPYTVSRFECYQLLSTQAVMQAGPDLLQVVEDAAREGIGRKIVQQILGGSGAGGQWAALTAVTGISTADYALADAGKVDAFQDGEEAMIDSGARPPGLAWALGRTLASAAARALLEPGSDRRTVEGSRMTLSGFPAQRDGSLTGTSGLLVDWSSAVAIVYSGSDRLEIVIDRITSPGTLKVTTYGRLGLAVVRPSLIYSLTQA